MGVRRVVTRVGGEIGRLVEPLHFRELIARAEEDIDVLLREVAMPRGDVHDDVWPRRDGAFRVR